MKYQLLVGEINNGNKLTHTVTNYRFKITAQINRFLVRVFWCEYYQDSDHDLFTEIRKKSNSHLVASMTKEELKEFVKGLKLKN